MAKLLLDMLPQRQLDYWKYDGWLSLDGYVVVAQELRRSYLASYYNIIGKNIIEFMEEDEYLYVRRAIDYCQRTRCEKEFGIFLTCPNGFHRIMKNKYIPITTTHTWTFFKMIGCTCPDNYKFCKVGRMRSGGHY